MSALSVAESSSAGILTAYQQGDFGTLDPQRVGAASEIDTSRLLHRTLTAISPGTDGYRVLPDLAIDTGRPDESGRTWRFRLRQGLRFEDGSALTAEDVRHGIERSFEPGMSGGDLHRRWLDPSGGYLGPSSGRLASIEVPSPEEIVFRLCAPCPEWPLLVAQPATAAVAASGRPSAARPEVPIASGPYRIGDWRPGARLMLVRNPHWDRETDFVRAAGPEGIKMVFDVPGGEIDRRLIADEGADRRALMLGSALEPATLADLAGAGSSWRVARAETGCIRFLALNVCRLSATQRHALADATDVDAFVLARGLSASQPIATILPPMLSGRTVTPSRPTEPVSRAGGFDVAVVMPDTEGNRLGMAALAASWRQQGIVANVAWVPNAEYGRYVDARRDQYDVLLNGWCALYPDPGAIIPALFHSSAAAPGGMNLSQYRSAAVDAEITRVLAERDPLARREGWNRLDDAIMQDVPIIPLVASTALALHGSEVAGCAIHPAFGQIDLAGVTLRRSSEMTEALHA